MSEMEGIEHHSKEGASSGDATTYPLTMDQRILQGDNYRNDHEMLSRRLEAIETYYKSLPPVAHPPHSGLPACERCRDRRRQIIEAHRDMYLTEEPDRWHSKNLDYRNQVRTMFDQPDEFTLADIYKYSQTEFRKHLQQDICSQDSNDTDEIVAYKTKAAAMFDQEINIAQIAQSVLEFQFEVYTDPDIREFLSQLQKTKTAKDRAPIYAKYYCGHSATDSPQVRNFKNKYGRMFESLVLHDTVVAAMKKEAAESQEKDVSQLQSRLEGLSLAQKANRKKVDKRAEEKGNREKGKEELSEEPESVECALGCGNEVSTKGEGGLQCALCDFLSLRDRSEAPARKQFFYCSVEHAEEDFDKHDRIHHACVMGDRCYYFPQPGPPGETAAGGICPDCTEAGYVSYFCSQDCYSYNMEHHRETVHENRGIENYAKTLEMVQPMNGMEIVAS